MKKLVLLALLLPSIVMAEGLTWLKKENPNQLFVVAIADSDCSMTSKELESLVKGVLVRSRIEAVDWWFPNQTTFSLTLECVTRDNDRNPVFRAEIRFMKFVREIEDGGYEQLITDKDYGKFGIGSSDFIARTVKEGIELAITDYLESNLDLVDD